MKELQSRKMLSFRHSVDRVYSHLLKYSCKNLVVRSDTGQKAPCHSPHNTYTRVCRMW